MDVLPEDIKSNLIITEFPDLNSLLISGASYQISKLTNLLSKIDQTVPVILIEVIIVDINKNYTISTGIESGIADGKVETKGTLFPNLDIQLGADQINKIINNFNGFGVINMGNINENFYMTLKALEEQGILNVSSTPKLATLNGHEATMSIGNTEYYLEEQSNFIGSQNPQLSTTQTYKPVNAELSIIITPMVSGDDQITLNIEVQQSDFTERISKTAPPGSVSRTFQSMIRVKNQETIILGGLEQKRKQDSSSGVPFLSRIPILKWLFSSRTKTDSDSRLNIFIKPTIIG
jgi:type IV pilus assembly protein PilQ